MYNVNRFCSRRKIIFVVVMFTLVCFLTKLGFWQLQRAQEKSSIIAKVNKPRSFHSWQPGLATPAPYEQVYIKGALLNTIFYLDNQWDEHQLGYDVLVPFLINKNSIVMVDLGWLPRITSAKLPDVTLPLTNEIQGYAYYGYKKQWILGETLAKRDLKQVLVEKIDPKLISSILKKPVYPFIVRLDPQTPWGFKKNWTIVNMTPERHKAYAMQWFSLAIVVVLGTFFVIFKNSRSELNH